MPCGRRTKPRPEAHAIPEHADPRLSGGRMATTELPVLNEENAPAGTALRPYDTVYGEAEILTYLARQHEPIDGYRLDGQVVVPPGILLACYARLVHES